MAFVITAGGSVSWRFVAGGTLLMVFGQSLVLWWWPHYASPGVPLVLAGAAMTLQRLARAQRFAHRRRPPGAVLLVLVSAYTLTVAALAAATRAGPTSGGRQSVARRRRAPVGTAKRAASGVRALRTGQMEPDASIHVEWVYNPADLGAAAVVFAHDLGPIAKLAR